MKFRITMKDGDAVYEDLRAGVALQMEAEKIPKSRRDALFSTVYDELDEFTEKWIQYGEYITVEFDTEAKTAVVVPVDV